MDRNVSSKRSTDELLYTTVELLKQISERIITIDDHTRRLDQSLATHIREGDFIRERHKIEIESIKKDIENISPILIAVKCDVDTLIKEYKSKQDSKKLFRDRLLDIKLEVLRTTFGKVFTILGIGLAIWFLLLIGLPSEYVNMIIPRGTNIVEVRGDIIRNAEREILSSLINNEILMKDLNLIINKYRNENVFVISHSNDILRDIREDTYFLIWLPEDDDDYVLHIIDGRLSRRYKIRREM